MRVVVVAVAIAAVGLLAAGILGVAGGAETPAPAPAAPQRTVSVQGVAGIPVASAAGPEAANAAYRQAMAAAIADGQSKAQFLAEKSGATLGAVQNVAEGGGYIECPGEIEYQGVQPDFGEGASVISARGVAVATPRAVLRGRAVSGRPHKPRAKRHRARKATVQTCTISTQVALVYVLG
jgi:hypothetical protein